MPRWRKEAFDRLPECRTLLQQEESLTVFFHEISETLYRAHLQGQHDLIRRIYGFAQWCLDAPRGKHAADDLLTIAVVSFYEHLPTHREVRMQIGRFLSRAAIEQMRDVFLHHGSEAKYGEMIASCNEVARTKG